MSMSITITTYHGLDECANGFMKRKGLRLLFLVGNPGASTSHSIMVVIALAVIAARVAFP
jgi:hypothetical protein